MECHGLDTLERVCFYEQDFYVLSNFSSFEVRWGPYTFKTAEHFYHWRRFFLAGHAEADAVAQRVMNAPSAHEAFRIAQANKHVQIPAWNEIKVMEMRGILTDKAKQHEYVRRKLLATGERELVENSWRDDFWGWGPNRDGQNMLGKLWMEVRAAIKATLP